jgi:hypothetical protein
MIENKFQKCIDSKKIKKSNSLGINKWVKDEPLF